MLLSTENRATGLHLAPQVLGALPLELVTEPLGLNSGASHVDGRIALALTYATDV